MENLTSWPRMPRPGAVLAAFSASFCLAIIPANAEYKVRSPDIDYHEVEIENNFSTTFDGRAENRGRMSSTSEIGVGVLPFWFVELEGEFSREPGAKWNFDATTFENYFMLTEPGKYWLDFALFAEYSIAAHRSDPDSVTLGALLQKQDGKWLHTLNLYWEKEVGSKVSNADGFQYAWQTRYLLNPFFQPGVEVYGQIDDLNHAGSFNEQQFRIGPMFGGSYGLGDILGVGKLKYEVGYLFGATTATEQGTLRSKIELEIPF
jgi:hypothetical protein